MQYISAVEVAKMVRKVLKEAFPGMKFSVRSDHSSIRIRWVDGPTTAAVESLVNRFSGSSFDGMIDLKTSNKILLDGEPVDFLSDFVFCERDVSDDVKKKVEEKFGWSFKDCDYSEYEMMMREVNKTDMYGEAKPSPTAERVTNQGADFSPYYPNR